MHLCTIVVLIFPIMAITSETSDIWHRAGRMTGLLLNKCFWTDDIKETPKPERVLIIFQECLQKRGLKVLHRAIGEDVIEVVEGVELVKYKNQNLTDNNGSLVLPRSYSNIINWKRRYIEALKQLFDTHILKIRLKYLDSDTSEGRTRRRQQNMFSQLLMFGLVAASFIVIPMGFQFLAILGGKALLLAKMALLLSSIQGLKKIATSNFNYGLYATPGHHQPWQYDRQWPFDGEEGYRGPGANYGHYEGYDNFHPRIDEVKNINP